MYVKGYSNIWIYYYLGIYDIVSLIKGEIKIQKRELIRDDTMGKMRGVLNYE
jgi:hypothetical protein